MKSFFAITLSMLAAVFCLMMPLAAPGVEPHNAEVQPVQMVSPVEYDPGLSDPFFETAETGWPWWIIDLGDGTFEDTRGEITKREDIPVLVHTADCRTNHQGFHKIRFSNARLLKDGTIELRIEDESASTWDSLTICIKNDKFSSQYRTRYFGDPPDVALTWTTTKQRLVLQKKQYSKGDIVRGRIEFECLQQVANPKYAGRNARSIRIEGPFKPELELE